MTSQGIILNGLTAQNAQSAGLPANSGLAASPSSTPTSPGANPAHSASTPCSIPPNGNSNNNSTNPTLSPNASAPTLMGKVWRAIKQFGWQSLVGLTIAAAAYRVAFQDDRLGKWTARKDFREACLSDLARNVTSPECESAISSALPSPPITKRNMEMNDSGSNTSRILLIGCCGALMALFCCHLASNDWYLHNVIDIISKKRRNWIRNYKLAYPQYTTAQAIHSRLQARIRESRSEFRMGVIRSLQLELLLAVRALDYKRVALFLDNGAGLYTNTDEPSRNPLLIALHTNNYKMIQLLLECGRADPALHLQQGKGLVPLLHLAMKGSNFEGIQQLLDAGANPNARGINEETALHIACRNGWTGMISLLLTYKVDVDAKSSSGQTAAHISADGQFYDGLRLLCCANANLRAADHDGNTVLHYLAGQHPKDAINFRKTNSLGIFPLYDPTLAIRLFLEEPDHRIWADLY